MDRGRTARRTEAFSDGVHDFVRVCACDADLGRALRVSRESYLFRRLENEVSVRRVQLDLPHEAIVARGDGLGPSLAAAAVHGA